MLVHNNDHCHFHLRHPYELPGQLVSLKIPTAAPASADVAPVVVDKTNVLTWADEISTSTSSPILVGDRVYVVSEKGDFCCVNALTGEVLWKLKIGIEERNSCPMFADGKLYVPILDDPEVKSAGGEAGTKGGFYIIKPTDKDGQVLAHVALDGRCLNCQVPHKRQDLHPDGPAPLLLWQGGQSIRPRRPPPPPEAVAAAGPAAQLQIIPSEVLLRPGQSHSFRVRALDANGLTGVGTSRICPRSNSPPTYRGPRPKSSPP